MKNQDESNVQKNAMTTAEFQKMKAQLSFLKLSMALNELDEIDDEDKLNYPDKQFCNLVKTTLSYKEFQHLLRNNGKFGESAYQAYVEVLNNQTK